MAKARTLVKRPNTGDILETGQGRVGVWLVQENGRSLIVTNGEREFPMVRVANGFWKRAI